MSTVTRKLFCKLTEEEANERARSAATILGRRDEIEQKLKAEQATGKANVKTLEQELRQLSTAAREKQELRDVECVWQRDDASWQMNLVRTDTYEIIESRPQTTEERQLALPRIGGEKKPAGGN